MTHSAARIRPTTPATTRSPRVGTRLDPSRKRSRATQRTEGLLLSTRSAPSFPSLVKSSAGTAAALDCRHMPTLATMSGAARQISSNC